MKGLALSKKYYEEYGRTMISETVPELTDRAAVGLAGDGSQCFGFDDEISLDHDYGPGFCMWISRETYDKIGTFLQEEYNKLPKTFRGITRKDMENGKGRVGQGMPPPAKQPPNETLRRLK